MGKRRPADVRGDDCSTGRVLALELFDQRIEVRMVLRAVLEALQLDMFRSDSSQPLGDRLVLLVPGAVVQGWFHQDDV